DSVTARNLELVTNLLSPKSSHSLLGVLNHTQTRMGARLLRMNILQPLCALKPFPDIDRLITSLIITPKQPSVRHAEQAINHVISLKHVLKTLDPLRAVLCGVDGKLLAAVQKITSDPRLAALELRIDDVINEDVTFQKGAMGLRNQRCYAVKAGFNGLLDVARQTYKETTNDVYELISSLSEKYDIALKVHFSRPAFHNAQAPKYSFLPPRRRQLPLEFINVVKKKKMLNFTTLKLLSYNDRIAESLTEVYLMSDKTIADLIGEIRQKIAILYKMSESIAMLDMAVSFAHHCTISKCVRPEFTDTLAISNGRHPIREAIGADPFVPNDIYAAGGANVHLVTGPNMSGKSTYLRQVALLTIMAQLGTLVPADYASVRLVDKLFSRVGDDSSVETNASSFTMEMRETAFILKNVTNESLIIIDELGRGTSTSDGLGITFAVCEELVRTKAFVFLATHFQELPIALKVYPNVMNLHLEVTVGPKSSILVMSS
ncbi:muts domain V-domain-containing protein, partial [Blyttiomyces helicus]